MPDNIFLSVRNMSKTFPGVKALDGVQIDIIQGEVHALVGENGAGKSTLIKILNGVYIPDPGSEIFLDSKPVKLNSSRDSLKAGINTIYQDLCLFPNLNVAENIYIGREYKGVLNWKTVETTAVQALGKLGIEIDITEKVGNLSVAKQQLVAIARAISFNSRLIIMDEPTATLTMNEIQTLYGIIDKLKKQGVSVLFISHKLDEIFTVSDRVTVLRDGKYIGTNNISDVDQKSLVNMMVGRNVEYIPLNDISYTQEDTILEVKNISKKGNYKDISLKLKRGEVLAITGLVGSGRTEVVKAIFGMNPPESGEILVNNEPVNMNSVQKALDKKIVYISENRQLEGLIMDMKMYENITLSILPETLNKLKLIKSSTEFDVSQNYTDKLDIKPPQIEKQAKHFSGGNQQKIYLAKWLATKPEILIIDEPTHGVDIGAKSEIHKLIRQLCKEGMSVIVVSSEWQEVLAISDRIIVMRRGRIVYEGETKKIDQKTIMQKAVVGTSAV